MAVCPNVVPAVRLTWPLAGLVRGPQSTAVKTKNTLSFLILFKVQLHKDQILHQEMPEAMYQSHSALDRMAVHSRTVLPVSYTVLYP